MGKRGTATGLVVGLLLVLVGPLATPAAAASVGGIAGSSAGYTLDVDNATTPAKWSAAWPATGSGNSSRTIRLYYSCSTAVAVSVGSLLPNNFASPWQAVSPSAGLAGGAWNSGTTALCAGAGVPATLVLADRGYNGSAYDTNASADFRAMTVWQASAVATGGTSGSATCSLGTFSNGRASYVNGVFQGIGRWDGSTAATTAWRFYRGSDGRGIGASAFTSFPVPGSAGEFYFFGSPSSGLDLAGQTTVKVQAYSSADASVTCPVVIVPLNLTTPVTAGGSSGPSDYGTATDPDGGSSCSGFDLFCRIKAGLRWAFVPSDAQMAAVTDLRSDLADAVPFSYVADVVVFVNRLTANGCNVTDCPGFRLRLDMPQGPVWVFSGNGAVEVWLRGHREFLAVAMWVVFAAPLAGWAWRTYAPATNGTT